MRKRRKYGFTLAEIMMVSSIIGLLAAVSIPSLKRARSTAQEQLCRSNLRQINDAIQQWALEKDLSGDTPVDIEQVRHYMRSLPNCPAGNAPYVITTVGVRVTCTNHPTL